MGNHEVANHHEPLRVFLSHKEVTRGHAARRFARVLENAAGGPRHLEVFVSGNIRGGIQAGGEWRKDLKKALREADALILLNADPSRETKWCIYEAGYFAALCPPDTAGQEKRLICIAPTKADIPDPLREWQGVELTRDGMRRLFEVLLYDPDDPLRPDLFQGTTTVLEKFVSEAMDAIGPPEERKPLSPRVWISVDPGAKEELRRGRLPDDSLIRGEAEAFREFGLEPTESLTVPEFAEKLEFGDAIPYFRSLLATGMCRVLDDKAGPFRLPPFRVRARGVARRLVFAYLATLPDGRKEFEFVVTEPWWTPEVYQDSASQLFQFLDLGMRFRQRVIVGHLDDLGNLDPDHREVPKRLRRLQADIDATILDSLNAGVSARARILNQFEPHSEERALVDDILREEGQWATAYTKLCEAVESSDLVAARTVLEEMGGINRTMTVLTARRLGRVLNEDGSGRPFLAEDDVCEPSGIPRPVTILATLTRLAFRFRFEVLGEYLSRELTPDSIPGLRRAIRSILRDFESHGVKPEEIEAVYAEFPSNERRRIGEIQERSNELIRPDGNGDLDGELAGALGEGDLAKIRELLLELSGLTQEYTGVIARRFAEEIEEAGM